MSMKLQKADPVEETPPGNGLRKTVQVEAFAANVVQAAADAKRVATRKFVPEKKDEKQRPPQLSSKRLVSSEFIRRDYRAAVETGVSWETVLTPNYWVACSPQLRAGDIIECVRDDLAYYGRVLVVQVFGQKIKVAPLQFVELEAAEPVDLETRSGFRVEDRGLTEKFCIIRLADGHVMATGIESAALAQQQIHKDFVPLAQRRGFS